jgi:hypothetical protein
VSIPVDLADLPARISQLGAGALLVTNSPDGPPHVASVVVAYESGNITVGAGRRTRANAVANPAMTLVWPAVDGEHCLIVDGRALDATREPLLMVPTAAVLHRLAKAPTEPEPEERPL